MSITINWKAHIVSIAERKKDMEGNEHVFLKSFSPTQCIVTYFRLQLYFFCCQYIFFYNQYCP